MKKAKIILDKDYVIGEIDRRMFGSFVEHLGRCVYKGVYEPSHETADEQGFRNDVKELIKECGITAIRYPGGNFVSGYNWKDGVGPREKRPAKKDMAWNVIETNEVGTNEFARYLKDMDVELIMAANLGTGTPEGSGEFVDYCNTEKGTYWSDLRREHGVKEPHNFKVWCLGNEMDGEWQIGMLKAEEYARKAKEAAKIMKWMDTSIELIACGTCTNEEEHKTFGEWDRIVLEETYDYINYISIHRYYNYDPAKQLFYKMHDDITDIPFFFKDMQNYLDTVISAADFVKGKLRKDKSINISFDEWGVITNTSAAPGGTAQEYGYASFRLLDAVIYGGILCTFLNNADRVKIACQSLLVNEGGMISTDPKGKAIRQATFYPFMHAAKFGKGVSLRPITELPKKATNHHGEQTTMTVSAAYEAESGNLNIFIMNCDLESDVETSLDLRSFGQLKALGQIVLYHEDYFAGNTFENEFNVMPQEKELSDPIDGKLNIKIKKHSWNVLRFNVR
ncbi:alpha-N-arabinofuranosidase [Anaerocolumna sedimenticola]|uniref:non-reducing end alpha-L-arabinofuranosidase n=1 Tax=Anaerocolumna sedimenticola TaxID=2696063 RepID=A0A6P1TNA1_9FIRM|nr:alpha-L-arabinofuranosidase C-terminal domain-containing protein [Anaerocolumna sedimenticola]QHQ61662.1 alpha-N-arabinofuranosidase [Anaerocolumna sedimenticola]